MVIVFCHFFVGIGMILHTLSEASFKKGILKQAALCKRNIGYKEVHSQQLTFYGRGF